MANIGNQKILSKDDAENSVIEYQPREFPARYSQAAVEFVKYQSTLENPDFKIDRVVSMTTGISEMEKVTLSERVEAEALERLKALQEEAYRQGYDLGRDEGQEAAYIERTDDLRARLTRVDEVVGSLETLKQELVRQNEGSFIKLIYQIASKIAMNEIQQNSGLIMSVLKEAVADSIDEETLTIRVAQSDLDFIEKSKGDLGVEFSFLKRAKLEAHPEIQPGGCVVVTNFGQIDATVEKRVEKVWSSIHEKIPKASSSIVESSSQDGDGGGEPS